VNVDLHTQWQERAAEFQALVAARYANTSEAELDAAAQQAGDWEFFASRYQVASLERDLARLGLQWLSVEQQNNSRDALRRIREICESCRDLYTAMQAVLVTHQSLPRSNLALAIKTFRPDLASMSADDVVGLLTAAWNGGLQGFEAVLRTRKNGRKTTTTLPWAQANE